VFDLMEEGLATAERVPWSQALRDRFTARFLQVRKHNDQNTPENPFLYLQSDGIWEPWIESASGRLPLQSPPLVKQMGTVFARFCGGLETVVAMPEWRAELRESLIARFFPGLTEVKEMPWRATAEEAAAKVAEESPEFGRSAAFRRTILDIYDHQCAACGLRIRLPVANQVSFIDAAHLLPWTGFRNDHPTNGLALCKNHHWAMDREILAPGPDLRWHVSKLVDGRRSNGELALAELAGKSLLLPKDPAFHPHEEGLLWRVKQLVGG
jgi:putative restriction endonuclease